MLAVNPVTKPNTDREGTDGEQLEERPDLESTISKPGPDGEHAKTIASPTSAGQPFAALAALPPNSPGLGTVTKLTAGQLTQ